MTEEIEATVPAERKNAVQLLRKATLTRLNKPKEETQDDTVYSIDVQNKALLKAKKKYPGFIPDPEVLQKRHNRKSSSIKNLKLKKYANKIGHSPSTSGDSGSSKGRLGPSRLRHNVHSRLLKRSQHHKSKLSTNNIKLSSPYKKQERISHVSLEIQDSIPIVKTPTGQINTPDPLGFLASKYEDVEKASPKEYTFSKYPKANNELCLPPNIPCKISFSNKIGKAHLRRSRSFNAMGSAAKEFSFDLKTLQENNQEETFIKKNENGLNLLRSKSLKNLKSQQQEDKKDENEEYPNKSSASNTFKRLLTFGKKNKPSSRKNNKENENENENHVNEEPTTTIKGLGRMKSFKWVGKRVLPEKQDKTNENKVPNSKPLNRSNTSNPPEVKEVKMTILERSATTGKIGGSEMIKSFKQLFDIFSNNKPKSPNKQDLSDVQLNISPIESNNSAKKVVIESPELNLNPIVIQSSDSLIDDLHRAKVTNSNSKEDKSTSDKPSIFFIPPKSNRRPNLSKATNSTTSLPRTLNSNHEINSEPNSAGLPPLNLTRSNVLQNEMSHFPDSPHTFNDPHSFNIDQFNSPNVPNFSNEVSINHNDIYKTNFSEIISNYTVPTYNLVHQGPVRQVITGSAWKSRFLFLFEHVLVITKLIEEQNDNSYFEIKKVIGLDVINAVNNRHAEHKHHDNNNNKYHPIILSSIKRFQMDPNNAIDYLISKGSLIADANSISKFLYFTTELNRVQLTNYLAQSFNHTVLIAFLNRFQWTGLRLDLALRCLCNCLFIKLGEDASDFILDKFATKWHQANKNLVSFRSELTLLLLVSLIELNNNITKQQFIEQIIKFDPSKTVPEHLLNDMYDSIVESDIKEDFSNKIEIKVDDTFSQRIIVDETSDSIKLTLSEKCPGLKILFHGQDLICDPPEIEFDDELVKSFNIKGTKVGKKNLMFIPTGKFANKIQFIPNLPIIIEQKFMKYAFTLSFTNNEQTNLNEDIPNHPDIIMTNGDNNQGEPSTPIIKKYMFAVENQEQLKAWTNQFESAIDMMQEAQDEALQKIEEELELKSQCNDAVEEADVIQKNRNLELARQTISNFIPHFDRKLTYIELFHVASKKEF